MSSGKALRSVTRTVEYLLLVTVVENPNVIHTPFIIFVNSILYHRRRDYRIHKIGIMYFILQYNVVPDSIDQSLLHSGNFCWLFAEHY